MSEAPIITVFDADPKKGNMPLVVTFTCEAFDPDGGSIVEYQWDFGDDSVMVSDAKEVFYSYKSSGNYIATCTVVDDEGDFDSKDIKIKVESDEGGEG